MKYEQTIWAETLAGQPGFSYMVTLNGVEVFGGWARGDKQDVAAQIWQRIESREIEVFLC